VFIPILLMGGIVGRLFREFAVTLAISIAISAVISLTLTPMMASRMLRHAEPEGQGRFFRASERAFDALLRGYDRGICWVLDHSTLMLAVTIAGMVGTVALYVVVPKGLFPQQDTGALSGITDAPQDISFPAMKERQERVNEIVLAHPAIEHMVSFIGGSGSLNTGNMFIALKQERRQTADEVIAELRPKLSQIPGTAAYLQSVQDVRMGGRATRTQYQYTLQDANLEELNVWAPRLLARLRQVPELRDVASDQQTSALQLVVDVDRDTAARLGVSLQAVDDALNDAFGQRQVATIFTQRNQYRVVLEVKPEHQGSPDALRSIFIPAVGGAQVPLTSIATYRPAPTSLSVNHQGQFPAVTISFNLAPGTSLGQALTAVHRAEAELGMPASVRAAPQGTAQAFVESLASEPYLVLAALIAVYIVLGVLYESYVHPVTILSTLPSAGVGALLALMLFRMEFSIIALIGVILLIGIVKKNAIMMVDFALEAERDEGLSTRESIHKACLLRFRPIMMTTMAALLGALPLAIGGGAGAELRRPLGITIVGGLLLSQLLTLFTTPVVYLALDRISRHRQRGAGPRAAVSVQ
jgi:multidrug efflux pump subunit AcrB